MSERDIKRDREWCEALKIRRWTSVSSRTEYGGDDSWIEACLTHDDTKIIGGDDVYEMGQALLDYLALCEHQQRMVEAAVEIIYANNTFCLGKSECMSSWTNGLRVRSPERCKPCIHDYLDQKAKEGTNRED